MRTPSVEYNRVREPTPRERFQGLDMWVHAAMGHPRVRRSKLGKLLEEAVAVAEFAPEFDSCSEARLRGHLLDFRDHVRRRPDAMEDRVRPALAALAEMSARVTGMRPYPVQIAGALALHRGYLAEMATGEGKTLTAALAAVLAGWTRRPCHVITVNDYLARRDARAFDAFYHACGLRCGHVLSDHDGETRRLAYEADITYTTSKEVTADFLRDRLFLAEPRQPLPREIRRLLAPRFGERDGRVQRGLHTAIVDEADSVLIDEAVTPVLISRPRPNPELVDACLTARELACDLREGRDFTVDTRYKEVRLKEESLERFEERCATLHGLWRSPSRRKELIEQALTADRFFHRGSQYVVESGNVVIVDESTGRKMPMRTWREGLHQAIECKEGLSPTDPSETLARISFQRFFRQYRKLAGMTGTASESAGEFWRVYGLPVISIPTHRPCVRVDAPDRVFAHKEDKWDAILDEVLRVHARGRPVLVGTRDVNASEALAARLADRGLDFQLLNAVRHAEEADVIKKAGGMDRVTIATNMAGRGTDILLGKGVRELGGLHVILSERHMSPRIDRQLAGRAGRQGDPGTSATFVSLEDDLVRRFAPAAAVNTLRRHTRPDAEDHWPAALLLVRAAQRRARRQALRQRESVLRTDTWIDRGLAFAGAS